jgi:hypothetical protein
MMKVELFVSDHSVGRPTETITLFLRYLHLLDLVVMISCLSIFFLQIFDDDAKLLMLSP